MAQPHIQLAVTKAQFHGLPRRRHGSDAVALVGGATARRCLTVVRNNGSDAASSSSRCGNSTLPTWMTVKPADSRQSPFYELELMELWDGIGKTRVRQHVNPLRREFQKPPAAPDWSSAFADPSLPLALDIGSGYGRFLLLLQRNNPQQRVNYLGLEIRRTLVDRANAWVSRLGLNGQVHYVFANATVSLGSLLDSYPGPVTDVFIQFPDPHFKRRHHKRRVVQPGLVAALRDLMPPGGRLLLQSDVEEACVAMRNMFERYGGDAFALAPQHRKCAVFFSRPAGQSASAAAAESQSAAAVEDADSGETHSAASGAATAATAAAVRQDAGPAPPINYGAAAASAARHAMAAAAAGAAAVRHAEDAARVDADAESDVDEAEGRRDGGGDDGDGGDVDAFGGRERGGVAADGAAAGASSAASTSDEEYGDAGGGGGGGDDESDADADIGSMVSEWAKGGWLVDNPIGTPTEREHYVRQQALPVYRVLLVRV